MRFSSFCVCALLVSCGGGSKEPTTPKTSSDTSSSSSSASSPSGGGPEVGVDGVIKRQIQFQVFGDSVGKPAKGEPETNEKLSLKAKIRYFHLACTIDVAQKKRTCIDVAQKRSPAVETKDGVEHFDGWTEKVLAKCFQPAIQPMPKSALDALNDGKAISRKMFGDGDVPFLYVAYVEKSAKQIKWSWETWTPRGKFEPGDFRSGENILALAGFPRGDGKVLLLFPADASGAIDPRFSAIKPDDFGEYHPGFEKVKNTLKALDGVKLGAKDRDAHIAVLFDQASLLAVLGDKSFGEAVSKLKKTLADGPPKNAALADGVKEGLPLLESLASSQFRVDNPCN